IPYRSPSFSLREELSRRGSGPRSSVCPYRWRISAGRPRPAEQARRPVPNRQRISSGIESHPRALDVVGASDSRGTTMKKLIVMMALLLPLGACSQTEQGAAIGGLGGAAVGAAVANDPVEG